MVVLVTGASGQLGQAIQFIAPNYPKIDFIFASSRELDITKEQEVTLFFERNKIDFCINTAAYTAVDKAESEQEAAFKVNVLGPRHIAKVCKENKIKLIHISTDFVFDGNSKIPYKETDITNPLGIYGTTKLEGELEVIKNNNQYFIIRTSWVYSSFGNNFLKTMLRLASERDSLSVVNDQIGTPTHAIDLAKVTLEIVNKNTSKYGIYHFSNEGETTWYDFAKEIFRMYNKQIELKPIPSESYPTPAKRPKYSVLDKEKIKRELDIRINNWQEALANYKF